jgi:hypothetical protein
MNAIIALNPGQMAEAQSTTITWAERKVAHAQREVDEADAVWQQLNAARLNVARASRMQNKAMARLRFYEKVLAALRAGYYIIPPFDLQLFAVRTDRKEPNVDSSTSSWRRAEQSPRLLPVGHGRYENPVPARAQIGTTKEKRGEQMVDVAVFGNVGWQDLELPVRALKPQVIEATGKALAEKIFDAIGIAPAYRAADPIIAGQIKRPDGKGVLTFFVAWWLDEADL